MPDKNGFDHLVRYGSFTKRCVWCSFTARPGASEGQLARHARKHQKDIADARAASLLEREKADQAVS